MSQPSDNEFIYSSIITNTELWNRKIKRQGRMTFTDCIQSWWFDPLLATVGFTIPIHVYTYKEIQTGSSVYKNHIDVFASKGVGDDQRHSLTLSLVAYWVGIIIWVRVVPKPADALPLGIPHSFSSLAILMVEVVSGIILYDAYFFFVHWAMHECKALHYLSQHEEHHRQKILEARHVLRHSLADGSLQVIVNIIVQRFNPWGSVKSRLARALHNVIVTWMLTESHTSSPQPNVFRKYFVGVRNHRSHHLSGNRKHTYQQFFGYLDEIRLFVNARCVDIKQGNSLGVRLKSTTCN